MELLTPTAKISPRESITIDNEVPNVFYNPNPNPETTVLRQHETDRFLVRVTATPPRELYLDWMITDAWVKEDSDGPYLILGDRSRYSLDQKPDLELAEMINRDRQHMKEILECWSGMDQWSSTDTPAEKLQVFRARAEVHHKPTRRVLGEDSISGCVYDSHEDFWQTGYFTDLVSNAIARARDRGGALFTQTRDLKEFA